MVVIFSTLNFALLRKNQCKDKGFKDYIQIGGDSYRKISAEDFNVKVDICQPFHAQLQKYSLKIFSLFGVDLPINC
ncbi:hypothetical protein BLA29_012498, partial [Euroglyphus maynei]